MVNTNYALSERLLYPGLIVKLSATLFLVFLVGGYRGLSAQELNNVIDSLRAHPGVKNFSPENVSISDTIALEKFCELAAHLHNRGQLNLSEGAADTAIRALGKIEVKNLNTYDSNQIKRISAKAYMYRGLARLSLSQLEIALKDLIEAESYARAINRYALLSTILCYQANCYGALLLTNDAIRCLNEAEALCEANPNVSVQINIYSNKAALYTSLLNADSAMICMEKAVLLARSVGEKYSELVLLLNSLSIGKSLNKFDFFEQNLQAAELLLPVYGGEPDWGMYHIYKGFWDVLNSRGQSALINLNQAYRIASKNNEVDALKNIFEIKSLLYAKEGAWDSSMTYFRKYEEVIVKSFNVDRIAEMSKAEANFETQKRDLIATEEIQRQRTLKWIAGIGFIIISGIAILIYRLWQRSREISGQLKLRNIDLEKINVELTRTQNQLIDTERQRESDKVRMSIARDIHDEIGSGLTKIGMLTELVKRKIRENSDESEQQLKKIAEYSRNVSSSLSEIVWAVNPTHDSTESLVEYSKRFAAEFLYETELRTNLRFEMNDSVKQIRPELKRSIFLVLKEGLNNAVKYSQATTLDVLFVIEKGKFLLKIGDDGIGFNTFDKMNSGNGLINMQSRMSQLGCQFAVKSEPGKGCTIEAWGNIVA